MLGNSDWPNQWNYRSFEHGSDITIIRDPLPVEWSKRSFEHGSDPTTSTISTLKLILKIFQNIVFFFVSVIKLYVHLFWTSYSNSIYH